MDADRLAPPEKQGAEVDVERVAPAWLVSLVVHLVLLLVLALITTPAGHRLTTVVLEIGQADDAGDQLDSFELAAVTPEINDSPLTEALEPSEQIVEMPQELFSADSLIEAAEPVQAEVRSVSIPVGGMMSGRSGVSKAALLAAYGGTQETEEAVQLGLKWLASQQRSDGSWSLRGPYTDGALEENAIAATAMAMLAFQGNGNTHQSGPYSEQLERAARWMVGQQERSGAFGRSLPRHQMMYAQAQASIAICELYAMTKDSWLREPAQRALDFAAASQASQGGWRYVPRQDSDTSVTGWFVMALQSGRSGGLEVNDFTLHKVGYFLDRVQHYDGAAYAYQSSGPPSPAMTAEGMLCRQYLGWARDEKAMVRCVHSLVEDYGFDIEDEHYYYWYYATQVLHHYGGSPWRIWNEKMRVELPAAQVKSGREAGSWEPHGARWAQAGRLYTTCMAIYCLEVYYRHMPLYSMELPNQ